MTETKKAGRPSASPALGKDSDIKVGKQKKKKNYQNPMKMERKKEGFRSKNPNVKFMDEMDAMTKGLKTLTSEGPGRVKVGSFSKGGSAKKKKRGAAIKGRSKILR